ncbi:Retrovirus-related Pol polyprotein from transposon 17.6, partial [Mucuna pruriens]
MVALGLLQPLPILEGGWYNIAMNFIEGLPKSNGKDSIWVIIDRLKDRDNSLSVKASSIVFHISQLKKIVGNYQQSADLPASLEVEVSDDIVPEQILAIQKRKKNGVIDPYWLVKWCGKVFVQFGPEVKCHCGAANCQGFLGTKKKIGKLDLCWGSKRKRTSNACITLKVEIDSAHQLPNPDRVGQLKPRSSFNVSPLYSPSIELKPMPSHLKYTYLDNDQWPAIPCYRRSPSNKEITKKLNSTILDVVKKEVTRLLAARIIYPISDIQWVSPVQVVPKKSRMTVMKNQHDELVTRKDHFPFPFIDQVLEKLVGKSHYCFLDGFSKYMQIHIALEDQYKTTFTCPFGTFAYIHIPFALCNAPISSRTCYKDCMEVFMDDFTVYATSFDACLENLSQLDYPAFAKLLQKDVDFNFDQPFIEAFQEVKTRLTSTPILQAPN